MELFFQLCRILFPVLLVVLSIAILVGAIGPLILPLLALAVIAFVVWLYLPRR